MLYTSAIQSAGFYVNHYITQCFHNKFDIKEQILTNLLAYTYVGGPIDNLRNTYESSIVEHLKNNCDCTRISMWISSLYQVTHFISSESIGDNSYFFQQTMSL